MLVPLTRKKFEQLIPSLPLARNINTTQGNSQIFCRRLLISVIAIAIILLAEVLLRLEFGPITFLIGVMGAFFWLWYPVFQASVRNVKCRRYKYSGFFRGRVLDWWITDQLMGKQETVNNKGELVIVENREKRINLEVGDNTGFTVELQAPLRNSHKVIVRGQIAEMIVMSNRSDLSSIEEFSDVYIPSHDLWVNDYPYLRRDFFNEVSRRLRKKQPEKPPRRRQRMEEA